MRAQPRRAAAKREPDSGEHRGYEPEHDPLHLVTHVGPEAMLQRLEAEVERLEAQVERVVRDQVGPSGGREVFHQRRGVLRAEHLFELEIHLVPSPFIDRHDSLQGFRPQSQESLRGRLTNRS